MFDPLFGSSAPRVDAALVDRWRERLTGEVEGLSDPERVDLLRALEQLKCTAAGVQAVVAAALDASQRAEQAEAGVPARRQGLGVGVQVGLARRESPFLGARHLGLAKALVHEMPHTLAALLDGRITEWRATIIARETACLTREDRARVDDLLAGTPARLAELESWGDRRLGAELLRLNQRLDVEALVQRRRRAESQRQVTGRPAPDTMMYVTALLPVKDGVAVIAALTTAAATMTAAGDCRSRGQVMADTLVARVTGRHPADGPTPVSLNVVLSDAALLAGADESAHLDGYGPIPAELARELASSTQTWLRRLYARPDTGQLIAMESRARLFPDALARLIRLRDHTCRTPWCNAPVRHTDHVIPHADGGPTSVDNGQGLCAACNHAKQAPGWQAAPAFSGGRHTVITTTPTHHAYRSTAPPLTG